jgi:hypothetical protein
MGMKPRLNDSPKPLCHNLATNPKSVPEHSNIPGTNTTTKEEANKGIPGTVSSPKP